MAFLLIFTFLAVAFVFGGWPWALVAIVVAAILYRYDFSLQSVAGTYAISFLWIGLYSWTGDRRFFFPYSMQFAVQLACLLPGRQALYAATGITALFAAIRVYQDATPFVLFVELVVAAIIIYAALYAKRRATNGINFRVVAGTLASLLAFFSLVVN